MAQTLPKLRWVQVFASGWQPLGARETGCFWEKFLAITLANPFGLKKVSAQPNVLFAPFPIEAFHLNAGFNCKKKCHLCDGCNWHDMSAGATWRRTCGDNRNGSPYWPNMRIPLLKIPGIHRDTILPDSLHCFHLGWGQDLAASGLVLLCKKNFFGGRYLNDQLSRAYEKFTEWTTRKKKTTGIDWWSKLKLDMASILFVVLVRFATYGLNLARNSKSYMVYLWQRSWGTTTGLLHLGVAMGKLMTQAWFFPGWKISWTPWTLWLHVCNILFSEKYAIDRSILCTRTVVRMVLFKDWKLQCALPTSSFAFYDSAGCGLKSLRSL